MKKKEINRHLKLLLLLFWLKGNCGGGHTICALSFNGFALISKRNVDVFAFAVVAVVVISIHFKITC